MTKYVIFSGICKDGVGDYVHFENIVQALLKDPLTRDMQYTAIVHFCTGGKQSNYELIQRRLDNLGIKYYLSSGDKNNEFIEEVSFQQELHEADQAIIVSYEIGFALYSPYLKKDTPIKFIGEHEVIMPIQSKMSGILSRSLGLSEKCYGLKINDVAPLEPAKAWEVIDRSDPEFSSRLLASTNSSDFEDFRLRNIIIPAYYNKERPFLDFVILLDKDWAQFNEKEIVIYYSGSDLRSCFSEEISTSLFSEPKVNSATVQWFFKDTNIKSIEIYSKEDLPQVISTNPLGSKTIKVITGFYLTDDSFNALYQLANMAAVSGDNTLERCLSMNVLPWYWSTNPELKWPTLDALRRITQLPQLGLSQEAKESFNMFFHPNKYSLSGTVRELETAAYNGSNAYVAKFNFQKMIEAWPIVTHYLRRHRNFYNQLVPIVLEGIEPTVRPEPRADISTLEARYFTRLDGPGALFAAAQQGNIELVRCLLIDTIPMPFISSVTSLRRLASKHDSQVIEKMEAHIQLRLRSGDTEDKLAVLPSEVAHIIGHNEIVTLFQTMQDEVSQLTEQKPSFRGGQHYGLFTPTAAGQPLSTKMASTVTSLSSTN